MMDVASLTSWSDRFGTAGYVHDDPARAFDRRVLEERARRRAVRRLHAAALPVAVARPHDGHSHAGHDGGDVRKIEVDEPRHGDEVRDSLHRLMQDVVGEREGIGQAGRRVDRAQDALVRDHDHGVDALAERFETGVRLGDPALALERERLGDDRDGQGVQLAGEAGDDRSRPGPGATSQTCRHEDHVGAVEGLDELLGVVEGGLAPDGGIGACAETLRQALADLQSHRRLVEREGLGIGVHDDEVDAPEGRRHHAVDGVSSPAADAHDLDARPGATVLVQRETQAPPLDRLGLSPELLGSAHARTSLWPRIAGPRPAALPRNIA